MIFNWLVSTTEYALDQESNPSKVQTYHWRCEASEGELIESAYGSVAVPDGDQAATIPTTEQSAIDAMLTLVDQEAIEEQLAARINARGAPIKGSGKLWEFPAGAKSWRVDVDQKVGDKVIFEGLSYNTIQAHRTQIDWPPPLVPALFEVYRDPTGGGTLPWVAGEAVAIGDEREFEGTIYVVLQPHTTQAGWEPPSVPALWAPK